MKTTSKLCSLLLCGALLLSLWPASAQAAGEAQKNPSIGASGPCGHSPAGEGGFSCPVCPVQALMDALPDAEQITAENREEVKKQLAAIDAASAALTKAQLALLSAARYEAAAARLLKLEETLSPARAPRAGEIISGDGFSFDPVSGTLTIRQYDSSWSWPDSLMVDKLAVTALKIEENNGDFSGSQFSGCKNLRSLDLSGCTGLTAIKPLSPDTFPDLESVNCSGCTSLSSLDAAFRDCASLKTADFSGCTSLNDLYYAFRGCTSLEEIDCSGCTSIESLVNAFDGCSSLKTVSFSGCTKLSNQGTVFLNHPTLESVDLSGCTAFRYETGLFFTGSANLKRVNFSGCSGISGLRGSFEGCTSLQSLDMSGCSKLERLDLNECTSLSELNGTFGGCAMLCELILPESIAHVGADAFSGCTSLAEITFFSDPAPVLEENVFSDCAENLTINSPYEAQGYTEANGWPGEGFQSIYPISVEAGEGGTASASPVRAIEGTHIWLTAEADDAHRFREWQLLSGNVEILKRIEAAHNEFLMPDGPVAIRAVFERADAPMRIDGDPPVTLIPPPGGKIVPAANGQYISFDEGSILQIGESGLKINALDYGTFYIDDGTVYVSSRVFANTDLPTVIEPLTYWGGDAFRPGPGDGITILGDTALHIGENGPTLTLYSATNAYMKKDGSISVLTPDGELRLDSTPASTIILPPGEALKPERDGTLILPPGAAVRTENGEPVTYPDGGVLNAGTGQATVTYRRVTFNSLGGSAAASAEVTHGNKLKRPADPVREGYTFGGWYREESCVTLWDFEADRVREDITLYARWTLNASPSPGEYTVAFDSRGGSAVGSITVSDGGRVIKPADPVREGYTFDGWYREESCVTLWDFEADRVRENTTLYAKWLSDAPPSPSEYTVAFDSRGGSAVSSITVSDGGRVIKPADPVREGYTFDGWYREESCVTFWDFEADRVRKNTTLYAGWTKNSTSGSEGSRSGSDKESREEDGSSGEYAFWQKVQKKIEAAGPGETVRIDARGYERMYRTVMEALRKSRQVTLVIRWKGKEEIVLSSEEALSEPMRIHYPLSYLAEYGFSAARTENTSEKKNPATGAACA